MARRGRLQSVIVDARLNAVLAWLLIGFVLAVVAENLLSGDLLWAGFAAVVAVLAVLPAVVGRRAIAMLPWEVLALAVLPLLGRSFATVALTSRLATYLSVAALALVVAVELDRFTPVRMTPGFAVLFVVVATMATAGIWAIVRWLSDVFFGTGLLLRPGLTEAQVENRLMWEFVWSTAAGVLAGGIFQGYFRRRERSAPVEVGVDGSGGDTT